ncbi:hypothetical protein L6773_12465 [Rhodohalobacter sp. WB101]|uniref:Uncharacterized protein n=1 Tax=Rhodohalobacter sulfatireducens TaxID=2911366 RepID=A0ABS9KEW2_9BACT|nr:hypothetical protein [Rhodohalobacter sulfatireducens]
MFKADNHTTVIPDLIRDLLPLFAHGDSGSKAGMTYCTFVFYLNQPF